ncbi:hypothetical protein B0H19DRAFT_1310921 [Mycena capillaripes]|nr:hypothetical protein B0H19DRAFT_1310921 [Mycena capillaripes]
MVSACTGTEEGREDMREEGFRQRMKEGRRGESETNGEGMKCGGRSGGIMRMEDKKAKEPKTFPNAHRRRRPPSTSAASASTSSTGGRCIAPAPRADGPPSHTQKKEEILTQRKSSPHPSPSLPPSCAPSPYPLSTTTAPFLDDPGLETRQARGGGGVGGGGCGSGWRWDYLPEALEVPAFAAEVDGQVAEEVGTVGDPPPAAHSMMKPSRVRMRVLVEYEDGKEGERGREKGRREGGKCKRRNEKERKYEERRKMEEDKGQATKYRKRDGGTVTSKKKRRVVRRVRVGGAEGPSQFSSSELFESYESSREKRQSYQVRPPPGPASVEMTLWLKALYVVEVLRQGGCERVGAELAGGQGNAITVT